MAVAQVGAESSPGPLRDPSLLSMPQLLCVCHMGLWQLGQDPVGVWHSGLSHGPVTLCWGWQLPGLVLWHCKVLDNHRKVGRDPKGHLGHSDHTCRADAQLAAPGGQERLTPISSHLYVLTPRPHWCKTPIPAAPAHPALLKEIPESTNPAHTLSSMASQHCQLVGNMPTLLSREQSCHGHPPAVLVAGLGSPILTPHRRSWWRSDLRGVWAHFWPGHGSPSSCQPSRHHSAGKGPPGWSINATVPPEPPHPQCPP